MCFLLPFIDLTKWSAMPFIHRNAVCLQETTVSEKVAAYLQGMSSYASAGGIVNTPRK